MDFGRSDGKELLFSRLDPFVTGLFKWLPDSADPKGSRDASARLFPEPGTDEDLKDDWKRLVEPELRLLFQSARETVARDLESLERVEDEEDEMYTLGIPLAHADAWLSCLNMARLVLAERYKFTEAELEAAPDLMVESERDLALLQMGFYAEVQQLLIAVMEPGS